MIFAVNSRRAEFSRVWQVGHKLQYIVEFRDGSLKLSGVVHVQRAIPMFVESALRRRYACLPHKFHRGVNRHKKIKSLHAVDSQWPGLHRGNMSVRLGSFVV